MAGLAASRPQQMAWLREMEGAGEDDSYGADTPMDHPEVPACHSTVGRYDRAGADSSSSAQECSSPSPDGRRISASTSFWRKAQRARQKQAPSPAAGPVPPQRGRSSGAGSSEHHASSAPPTRYGPPGGQAYDHGYAPQHGAPHGYPQSPPQESYSPQEYGSPPPGQRSRGSYAVDESRAYPLEGARAAPLRHQGSSSRAAEAAPPQRWALTTRAEDEDAADSLDDEEETRLVQHAATAPRPGSLAALLGDDRLRAKFEQFLAEDDSLNALRFWLESR